MQVPEPCSKENSEKNGTRERERVRDGRKIEKREDSLGSDAEGMGFGVKHVLIQAEGVERGEGEVEVLEGLR